jgi:catechol 2,3-dioxygenase-like lactoylglutathione lyase family enzyme
VIPWLDHVALATDSLDRAAAAWERLGFTLTPRSSHSGADGPWGTGNHCMMFREGYFELIGVTDPALYHEHLRVLLDSYTGLHLMALGTDDSDATFAEVRAHTPAIQEPYAIARQVPFGKATREGRFRISEIDPAWFGEADLFFCQHDTPEVLWQEDLLHHANGVTGLAGVVLVCEEPDATADKLSAVTGVAPVTRETGLALPLARGRVELTAPAVFAEHHAGISPPLTPWVGTVIFHVADLGRTHAVLTARQFTVTKTAAGLLVPPTETDGATVLFQA